MVPEKHYAEVWSGKIEPMNSRKDVCATYANEIVICNHLNEPKRQYFGLLYKKEDLTENFKIF